MMEIGRKIYYEKDTGNVIVDTGERSGDVVPTTIEQDFRTYTALAGRVPDSVGCLELAFGSYPDSFAKCNGYRVDVDTKVLQFSYPKDDAPNEIIYVTPLEDQVAELKEALKAQADAINFLLGI